MVASLGIHVKARPSPSTDPSAFLAISRKLSFFFPFCCFVRQISTKFWKPNSFTKIFDCKYQVNLNTRLLGVQHGSYSTCLCAQPWQGINKKSEEKEGNCPITNPGRRPTISFLRSTPSPLSLSLSLSWPFFPSGDHRAGGAVLGQVFAGDDHPPGMPTHSLSFLPCETERPKP